MWSFIFWKRRRTSSAWRRVFPGLCDQVDVIVVKWFFAIILISWVSEWLGSRGCVASGGSSRSAWCGPCSIRQGGCSWSASARGPCRWRSNDTSFWWRLTAPETSRKMMSDLIKNMASDRRPYGIVTRMFELIGWKRLELNSILSISGVSEQNFESVLRSFIITPRLSTLTWPLLYPHICAMYSFKICAMFCQPSMFRRSLVWEPRSRFFDDAILQEPRLPTVRRTGFSSATPPQEVLGLGPGGGGGDQDPACFRGITFGVQVRPLDRDLRGTWTRCWSDGVWDWHVNLSLKVNFKNTNTEWCAGKCRRQSESLVELPPRAPATTMQTGETCALHLQWHPFMFRMRMAGTPWCQTSQSRLESG